MAFISAIGNVGCSPDKTRKTLVGSFMLDRDANKYIRNLLTDCKFYPRKSRDETVEGHSKQEPDSSSPETSRPWKESSRQNSDPVRPRADGHDLDQSIYPEGHAS